MPPLQVLIKPASSNCNLRCRYCFYLDEADKRSIPSYGVMQTETLKTIVRKSLAFADRTCTFGFQGGEPTLAGLSFFQSLIDFQQQYNTKKLAISNNLQTNGYLLDDEWAQFLSANHFLIGLSLDGNERAHNLYRQDARGNKTFDKVLESADLLRRHGVEFNILTVVTAYTARNIDRIYHFFRKQDLLYQQYIPCLDPLDEQRGQHEYSLTPDLYARFLKTLFDLWFDDVTHGRFIYIRYFENLLGIMKGFPPEHCGMAGHCQMQHIIEADGSVYPCDFYALDRYLLGNLTVDDFPDLYNRLEESQFIAESAVLNTPCQTCQWYSLCRGGCRRDRDIEGTIQLNYYCSAYQKFFRYAQPRLTWLCKNIS